MGDFKKRVLKVAIEQINKFTDIEVTYTQKKEGRTITDIDFTFVDKHTVLTLNDPASENLYKLTAKQILYFSQKLCNIDENPDFGRDFGQVGETQEDFHTRIEAELKDKENIKKYFSYLLSVGYKPKYRNQK